MSRATQPRAMWAMVLIAALTLCLAACGGGSAPPPPGGGGSGSPSITTSMLPEGWSGEPYSATLQATGGRPPYTWTVLPAPSSGPVKWLHAGLSLSSSGTISGVATESGTHLPTFEVRDSAGLTSRKDVFLTIHLGVLLDPAPLPDGIVGRSYFGEVRIQGGQGPYTLSVTPNSDPLPAGLILTDTGTSFRISGTPVSTGTARLEFQVRDLGRSRTFTATYPLRIVNPLTISPASLPAAGVGFPYSMTFSVTGGVPPYTWSLVGSSQPLPPGLSFAPAGIISGTPTTAGFFVTFVQVQDSGSPPQTANPGDLRIVDQFTITKTGLAFGVVDKSYRDTLEAAGGQAPFTWSVLPSQFSFDILPPGTSLSSNGEVSGVPTLTGSFNPMIEVSDSASPQRVARATAFIHISPRVSFQTTTLPDAVHQVPYGPRVFFSGGMTPYMLRVSSGTLPPGLALNATVLRTANSADIVGTPTTIGQFQFTLEVTDSTSPPDTISQPFVIRVNPLLVFNAPSSLPDGFEGTPYSFTFAASGGLPPYTWVFNLSPSAALGLTFDADSGAISGTPTEAFSGNLSVRIRDSSNPPQMASGFPTFRVIGILRVATTKLPNLRAGESISIVPAATGGEPPYSWTLVSGALPAGVTFNSSSGAFSGRPTNVESQTFTLQVRDSSTNFPQTTQQTLTMNIVSAPGRNDSIATATPLSNGRYAASLSPHADPPSGAPNPDTDYYAITASAGAVITIETFAERLALSSPMDSVIEIVDANGNRFNTCNSNSPFTGLFFACMNDDHPQASSRDSILYFQVPGTPGAQVSFFVRVLDWRGDARPDFIYEIKITGAN